MVSKESSGVTNGVDTASIEVYAPVGRTAVSRVPPRIIDELIVYEAGLQMSQMYTAMG